MPRSSACFLKGKSSSTTYHARSAHSCLRLSSAALASAMAWMKAARLPLGTTSGRASTMSGAERASTESALGAPPRSLAGLRRRAIM